jgi:N6-adenosine-specific RNA methylase IME4/transposase-like protein
MKKLDEKFTKLLGDLLLNAKGFCDWGIAKGITTPEDIRFTVTKRQEVARTLISGGASERKAARALGISQSQLRRDLGKDAPKGSESAPKRGTGSPETLARREAIAEAASAEGITSAPTEKYRIIYADPPWHYGAHLQPDYHTEQRDHYPAMPLEEICALPVKDWVENDAVTSPFLEKAFQVVGAWGFEYKAQFVWDKIKHNMGHYNSVRHENLFVCTRGACQPDYKHLFDSVQSIERGKHSAKPVDFYDIIETNYTHGRRLEIFARTKREGWDVYGHVAEIAEAAE